MFCSIARKRLTITLTVEEIKKCKERVREESKVSYKIVKFSHLFTLQGRRKEREPVIFTGARDSKGAPEEQKFL